MEPIKLLHAILPDVLIDNFDVANFENTVSRFTIPFINMKKRSRILLLSLLLCNSGLRVQTTQPCVVVEQTDGTVSEYLLTCAPRITYAADVEAVDLVLPSGTLWANMNVGATRPEDNGDYFAWGETEPKAL